MGKTAKRKQTPCLDCTHCKRFRRTPVCTFNPPIMVFTGVGCKVYYPHVSRIPTCGRFKKK